MNKFFLFRMLGSCVAVFVVGSSLLAQNLEKWNPAQVIASEKTSLKVGEQKSIHLGNPLRVNVSRRGVIHLIESSASIWRMTGLRSGVVAVEVHLPAGAKKVIYVEVLPKPSQHLGNADPDSRAPVSVDEAIPRQFDVKAQIELLEEQAFDVSGASGKANAAFDLVKGSAKANVLGAFEMREKQFKRRVIGEPHFSVHEDEDAIVKSGGESLQDRTDEEGRHRDVWHEYGLSLSVKLHELSNKTVTGNILFVLKSPSGNQQGFSLNHIQTKALLTYGRKTLIGSVDLASNDEGDDRDSLMSQIPIIGPLFKQQTHSTAHAIVQLWVEVQQHLGGGN